jgi:hypothetical protein
LVKELPVQLTLVKKLDPSADELPNIPQMDLVDDNSYLGGTHEQLTSKKKEKDDVFLMSMWDIEKKFKLKLEWLDYLEIPSVQRKSGQEKLQVGNVFIETAVVHGGDTLTAILTSNEYRYERVVRFSQWLKSSLEVQNIPKVRKLNQT